MNQESRDLMLNVIYKNLKPNQHYDILDVGSYDINGTHKPIFANNPLWNYVGLDVTPGPNVDLVATSDYNFGIADESYDVVISANTVEHVKDIFSWIKEVARVAKKGGLICIISPTYIKEHKYPIDCWRIMPDGMSYLFEIANLEIISCEIDLKGALDSFLFTVGIARKREV